MAPRNRRNNLLLPLALGATAAAASFALWYFLNDDDQQTTRRTHVGHESSDELPRHVSPPPAAAPPGGVKKSVALVVRESSGSSVSELLAHLPMPLPLDRANIFILVYSPGIKAHPLSDSDAAGFEKKENEGRVYRQARKLFPRDAPRELVLPYTDEASVVPMLKQLAPESVYMEASVAGDGRIVVAVLDPTTGQRLADETGKFGKKCRVLDVAKAGDDWMERICS
ncbi:hypothetical protein BDD12DRAFT_849087 [Trichophaea hybrida]|nr:hypothetical protein BDD12DRAFT_849087 [Trichophaea hybrida]